MNKREKDILITIYNNTYVNQRILTEQSGYSLGTVNKCIKNLTEEGYLDSANCLTKKAEALLQASKPQNAIILAAGFGMRMVPINMETPKGLLEVRGEPLIERLIRQLKEVGITEIYVVVGFMKESYEYLIDSYGVEMIVNTEYTVKNNLHSLKKALCHLKNTYIVPCDIWCAKNPFHRSELYSWYMVSKMMSRESKVRVNRKGELVEAPGEKEGNRMLGISYLLAEDSQRVRERINAMSRERRYDNAFWEEALVASDKQLLSANVVSEKEAVEINTYEQLRELDSSSSQLKSHVITLAAEALKTKEENIQDIAVLKKGMTNRSFLFRCEDKKYIMRIPGEGTERLIDRDKEFSVYSVLRDQDICDHVIYINPQNGYKITEYIENARVCDPVSESDLKKSMDQLRKFHELKLQVDHQFDIFTQINFYESLWQGAGSVYRDYEQTKANVLSLKRYIDKQPKENVLTHIDAVPDNFLFYYDTGEKERVRLIDWEYAGMQDPHVDLAMFCIYALYDRMQIDRLIDIYFQDQCTEAVRIKIYCYIAACGLLWSNWCEYKRSRGIEFGEYSLRQYRYAKDFYRIVKEKLTEESDNV